MALSNILKASAQVDNGAGGVLAGGFVFLYVPGTTTFITAYRDSGLVSAYSQPIRLSGSGRAEIWISRDCDMVIEDRNNNVVITQDNANPDALGVNQGGGLVPNGSFEIDTDADLIPDGWDNDVSEAGSTNAIDATESTDGAQCWANTSTGVGGGQLVTIDFFPVNDVDDLRVNFDIRSTVAAVRNIVRVEWYDAATVFISNSDVYDSTANPTVFTSQNLLATPPALARFAKLRLIGIDPSVALAGVTRWDRIQVFYPAVVAGVFDNITIQNNQIITTNTNGDLELGPDGMGAVNISSVEPVNLVDAKNSLNLGTNDPANDPHLALGRSQANAWAIQAKLDGTNVGAENLELNPHGGNVHVGPQIAGSGGVFLYLSSLLKAQTSSRGFSVRGLGANDPGLGGDQQTQYILTNTAGQQIGDMGFGLAAEPNIHLKNNVQAGLVRLIGTDTSLAETVMLTADPDGGMIALFGDGAGAAVERFATESAGAIAVRSDGNLDTQTRRLVFEHQDGTIRGFLGHSASDVLQLRNQIDGGNVLIHGSNAATLLRSMIVGDPDDDVEIWHPADNTINARTIGSAAGGLQARNDFTGGGLERVLTDNDRSFEREVLPDDLVITNDVVLTNIAEFVAGVLAVDNMYFFRCVLFVTTALTGATPGLQMRGNLSGNAVVGTAVGVVTEYDAAAIINTSLDPDNTLNGILLDSTLTKKIVYEGAFESNDAAQVFSIQVAQENTSASDTTIEAGSFFEIWRETL